HWERLNTGRADRIVVPSRYSASVAGEVYGVPPEKLAVVPEPIDLAEWRRRFARADRRPATRPTVLSVARMYPRKRLADLLEAVRILRARIPRVRSEEHTSELQSRFDLVCRLLLEKKKWIPASAMAC